VELRHLRYFVAVATEENIGRAARRLNVSQPALTKQIHDLERELGVQLFERTARGVALTSAGSAFLAGAEVTLASANNAVHRAQAAGRDVMGRLAIGHVRPDAHLGLVEPILRTIHQRYPSMELSLSYLSSAEQWRALRDWRLDVGFAYSSPPPVLNLAWEQIDAAPLTGVLLGDDHPLATAAPLRLRDLAPFPCVMFPRDQNPVMYDQILRDLAARGVVPTVIQEGASVALGVATRINEHGWALSNGLLSSHEVPARTVFRPFDDEPIPFWLSLVWRRHDETPLVPLFLSVAREVRDAGAHSAAAAT
jgi:DNA-binding transcriptional LysR family regulator